MTLTQWNPVGTLAGVEIDRLNQMFGHVFGDELVERSGAWMPAVDIFETPSRDVVLKVELPAMKREDIKVTCENNVLTIEGERALDAAVKRDQYHRMERPYGAFRRSFTLAPSVDASRVQAAYQDGVLTITLPQREDAKPRQIPVNG
jgi:HSP20 family protein